MKRFQSCIPGATAGAATGAIATGVGSLIWCWQVVYMSKREVFGLIAAGIVGGIAAFAVIVLLGSTWREAMPASSVVAVIVPTVTYYAKTRLKKTDHD